MFNQSRRDFVISAAAASAAFGLAKPLAFISPAEARDAAGIDMGFHKFKVGDIEMTTVYDGLWVRGHDPGFIKNASVDETKAALKAAGLSGENVPIPFTVTFATIGGKTIMFDSGTGAQLAPTAGRLAANMELAGIDATKIETVIVTHFHPDHIFGLMEKGTNAQTFPQAQIFIPSAEMAWWGDEGVFAKLSERRQGLAKRVQATFPNWKNIKMISKEGEVVPGVFAIQTFGHTPGHTSYLLSSGKEQLMVLGDVANIPALFVRNPEWHATFDMDAPKAVMTRRATFDRAVSDNAIVTGYHFGMPGAGRIEKDGAGYAFVPVA